MAQLKLSESMDIAIELLGDESKWCRGELRMTKDGAQQHCLAGALMAASGIEFVSYNLDDGTGERWYEKWTDTTLSIEGTYRQLHKAVTEVLLEQHSGLSIPAFNDRNATHADVVNVMTKARNALQEQGK